MAHLPLEGIRVLDITVVWSGPTVTMLLSDLGAEVIRVDNPWLFPSSTRGMVARPTEAQMTMMGTMGRAYPDGDPAESPHNRHAMFNWHARGKKMMTLDLRKESGRDIFIELAKTADVFVENNNVAVLGNLGIDWETLHAANPRLILLRMPPAGIGAPYSSYLGFGAHFEAFSGITAVRGYADSAPATTTSVFQMDPAAGSVGAFAVMAALRRRQKTGEGELVVLPQVENEMNHIGEMFIDAAANGYDNPPLTNRDRNFVQGAYPTSEDDRFVTITIRDDEEWRRAVEAMGNPEWAADDRFATQAGRLAAQDDIDAAIADWTRSQTRQEVFTTLQAVGVPAGPIMLEDDVFADPHVKARGFLRENTGVSTGTHLYPSHSWKWDGPDMKWEPIGGLGLDNEYVYKEVLGFSDEQYQQAERDGHIATSYLDPAGNPI